MPSARDGRASPPMGSATPKRSPSASPAAVPSTSSSSASTGDDVTIFERLARAIRSETPMALATRLDDTVPGAKLLVGREDAYGDLGSDRLNEAVAAEARALLAAGET